MSIDSINNQKIYSDKKVIDSYLETSLYPPEKAILEKYKPYFCNKNVLDIGCGTGRTTQYFQQFTDQYIGIDYSEGMIDTCKTLYPGITFHVCDARNLDQFKANSFDFVIFSYNGIDYVSDSDRKKILSGIRRS